MSGNSDLARSIFADRERGDYRSTDWAYPEIEYVIVDGPSPGAWRGLAGMAKGIRDIVGSWEGYRTKADAFRELDDERVLVLTSRSGRGRTSGVELDELQTRGASLIQVGDGTVTKIVNWFDRDRALADLGLAPEGEAP
jgi:hypothetical protein